MPQAKKAKHQHNKDEAELTYDQIWDDSALIDSWNSAFEEYQHYHSLHARGENVEALLDKTEENDGHEPEEGEDESEAMELEDAEHGEVADDAPGTAAKGPQNGRTERGKPSNHEDVVTGLDHPYHKLADKLVRKEMRGQRHFPDEEFMRMKEQRVRTWKTWEVFLRSVPDDHAMKQHFIHNITHGKQGLNETGVGAAAGASMPTPADVMNAGPQKADDGLRELMMSWYWAGYYGGLYEGKRQVAVD